LYAFSFGRCEFGAIDSMKRLISNMILLYYMSSGTFPLPSARQHGDFLEVKREYYQNCSVMGCVTQCSQSAAHSYEQFLQVQQIGFVTLEHLRHA